MLFATTVYGRVITINMEKNVYNLRCNSHLKTNLKVYFVNISTVGVYFRSFCRNIYSNVCLQENDCDLPYRNFELVILNKLPDTTKMASRLRSYVSPADSS